MNTNDELSEIPVPRIVKLGTPVKEPPSFLTLLNTVFKIGLAIIIVGVLLIVLLGLASFGIGLFLLIWAHYN